MKVAHLAGLTGTAAMHNSFLVSCGKATRMTKAPELCVIDVCETLELQIQCWVTLV